MTPAERGPRLIVVTGLPGAGKTTVATRLAAGLGLASFTKDDLKEALFEALGPGDRAWSRRLSGASFELLHRIAAAELAAGRGLVVEGNFDPAREGARYRALAEASGARPVQVLLVAPGEVLCQRFAARARHPGHGDAALLDELRPQLLAGRTEPLDLGGPLLVRDTRDLAAFDHAGLLAAVLAAGAGA